MDGHAADVLGKRLLGKTAVIEIVDEQSSRVAAAANVTAERVVKELAIVAFSNLKDFVDWNSGSVTVKSLDDIPEHLHPAIAEITLKDTKDGRDIKVRLHSKMDALAKLGDYLGMFKKRVELADPQGRNPFTAALEAMWDKKMEAGMPGNGDQHQLSEPDKLPEPDETDV